jgi:hypothetical protein
MSEAKNLVISFRINSANNLIGQTQALRRISPVK